MQDEWINSLMSPVVFRKTPAQVKKNFDFSIVLSQESLEIRLLNKTGHYVYQLVDSRRTVQEVVEHMKTKYPGVEDANLTSDVCKIVRDLESYGLIRQVAEDAGDG